jgi:hypothetical protein
MMLLNSLAMSHGMEDMENKGDVITGWLGRLAGAWKWKNMHVLHTFLSFHFLCLHLQIQDMYVQGEQQQKREKTCTFFRATVIPVGI